ncbi:hypothetical protein ACJU26_09305 [Acidithiobacillus sp. M4-SHS-6]|uniref:hypothetical protein n=1 Tax=Acidithiobacillus sp. M4-SHS-6 TaxID=3383024 RepID=UPI0039BE7736
MEKEKRCKCKCKDWGETIAEFGGFTINQGFPLDSELLPIMEAALVHLEATYRQSEFNFRYASLTDMVMDFRGTQKANVVVLARMAPRQHWVSYVQKILRHWLMDAYFLDLQKRNPFSGCDGYAKGGSGGGLVAGLQDYRKMVDIIGHTTTNDIFSARTGALSPEEELDEAEMSGHLRARYPIIWAMRRGYSLADIKRWLSEARKSRVNQEQLRRDILAEASSLASAMHMDWPEVQRNLTPLLGKLRGTRGPYKSTRKTAARKGDSGHSEVLEMAAIQRKYAS